MLFRLSYSLMVALVFKQQLPGIIDRTLVSDRLVYRGLSSPFVRRDGTVRRSLKTDGGENTSPSLTAAPHKKLLKTQLKKDLKEYRLLRNKKTPYTVFTNSVVDEIYFRLPTTFGELSQCKGIGPAKLHQYGKDILAIVAPYTKQGNSAVAPTTLEQQPINAIEWSSLTTEQQDAANLILSSKNRQRPNFFVSGQAGTGKSFLLRYLVQELRKRMTVGVCAPTGVAAIHVGGNTLHSYFGIGLGNAPVAVLISNLQSSSRKETQKRIDATDVLIIDECSMLSSVLLEKLDQVVREVRKDGKYQEQPFGGMQVLLFGDFFQLPPIDAPFCFESSVWHELGLQKNRVELKQVQRQDDLEFVQLLNRIRIGQVQHADIDALNQRCLISRHRPLPNDGISPTLLYSHNVDVDAENEARLSELDSSEVVIQAINTWKQAMPAGVRLSVKKAMQDSLVKEIPEEVKVKVGAQVMLTRNRVLDKRLVNGSRGVVVGFKPIKRTKVSSDDDDKELMPVVRFDCGITIRIGRVESLRHNPDGGVGCLAREQVPLKLAWALTVHKSQGATLTRASLDLNRAFAYGQAYVALSRVKSLDGLWLEKPARLSNIKVCPQVLDFYNRDDVDDDEYDDHKVVTVSPRRSHPKP